MTPLEQKAREYADKEYPKSKDNDWIDDGYDEGYNDAANPTAYRTFIAGYTEALRWRDVNMERVPCGIKVILKQEDRYVGFGFFYDGSFTHSCNICDNGIRFTKPRFTHWRPIETI